MDAFNMKSWIDGDITYVDISGAINEHAQFSEVRLRGQVNLNLSGVTAINSIGTRTWCLWIQRFRSPTHVTLVGCPPIMVKSFSSVRGFLTERCLVRSFKIPFFSEVTGESQEFLAVRGIHFDGRGLIKLPEVKDSQGNVMEMDVLPAQYLAFLKS